MGEEACLSEAYHDTRFERDPKRAPVWRALWRYYFRSRIASDESVLDLGSGYGDFINNVEARRRIALDSWPGFAKHLEHGVEAIVAPVTDLSAIADGSVDYAFASNLFEHITKSDLAAVLAALRRKLSARGRLTMLQPNYRYCSAEYFDDYTHITVWSHVSLADFLRSNGYEVLETHPRFMPLTVKSNLPVWGPLIGAYLLSPVKPMGKQMLLSARPRR
jgi:ubiquinone/menaquinone biosynthesis C-methylase UbiE